MKFLQKSTLLIAFLLGIKEINAQTKTKNETVIHDGFYYSF